LLGVGVETGGVVEVAAGEGFGGRCGEEQERKDRDEKDKEYLHWKN